VLLGTAVRSALAAQIERLRPISGGIGWVAAENLHLTLKFLGAVEADRLDAVRSALDDAAHGVRAFDFTVEGLGAFPSLTRPRVIWAGITCASAHPTCASAHPTGASAHPSGASAHPTGPSAHATGASAGVLTDLAERVERELTALGFPREARAFSPHITLGRVREPRPNPKLAAALDAARALLIGEVRVDRVCLMRSDLSPRGARYTELSSHALA
jgi:RNA 2',3'-cyclic 3'-phosphodiesterase